MTDRLARLLGLDGRSLSPPARAMLQVAFLAVIFNLGISLTDVARYGGIDLRARVVGARALVLGLDPYRPIPVGREHAWLFDPHGVFRDVSRCPYDPPLLALYALLCWLPYTVQRGAWSLIEWTALLVSLRVLARSIRAPKARLWFVLVGMVFFAAGAFWRLHVERGQYYALLLLLLAWSVAEAARAGRDEWRVGLPLGLAAALRPTIIVVAAPLWLLGCRRAAAAALGAAVGVVVLLLPLTGIGLWRDYARLVDTFEKAVPGLPALASLPYAGWVEGADFTRVLEHRSANANVHLLLVTLARYTGWPPTELIPRLAKGAFLVTFLALCALVSSARRRPWRPLSALAVGLTFVMATDHFLPVRWGYNDVLYLAPLAILMPTMLRARGRALLLTVMTALVLGHSFFLPLDQGPGTLARSVLLTGGLVAWTIAATRRMRPAARTTRPGALAVESAPSASSARSWSGVLRGLRPDRAALALIAALAGLMFGEAILGAGIYFQRDVNAYWWPQVESLKRVVSAGAPPVWNPYFEVGLPMLADPGYQLFYPPQWLIFLLSPATFYAWFIAVHAFFGAVGAFLLGRAWGLGPAAAFGSAAVWLASGPFLSLVSNDPQLAGAAWIPWVLVALEHALTRGTARAAAALGAAAALQLLAGSGDFALMTAQLATLRVLLWLVRAPLSGRDRMRRALRLAIVGGGLALALSAALWMPVLATVRGSGRAHMTAALASYWSVHPASLLDLWLPQAVSLLPLTPAARQMLFEGREPFLSSLYLGAAAALIVPLGLLASRLRALLLLALFSILLAAALGRHGVIYGWVFRLPGTSLFRYPVKYLLPATLVWAALVGLGLRAFGQDWPAAARRFAVSLAVLALLAAGALVGGAGWLAAHPRPLEGFAASGEAAAFLLSAPMHRTAFCLCLAGLLLLVRSLRPEPRPGLGVAALVLVVGDLALASRGLNPLAPAELMRRRPPLLDAIAPRADGFPTRIFARVPGADELNRRLVRGPAGWDREWSWTLGLQEHLSPPRAARWGLAGGYDGDFTGLAPPALGAYSAVVRHPRAGPLALTLLRLGGIEYVVSLDATAYGLPPLVAAPSVYDAPLHLFRVPAPVPRAYLARERRAPDEPRAWERLAARDFDPQREVVLVGGVARPAPPLPEARLQIVRRRADRVELDIELPAPAWAVLTEMRTPGWAATVDGAPVPVETANLLFCAAPVPAGGHRVVFEYRPPGARLGLACTAGGLIVLTLVLAGGRAGVISAARARLFSPARAGTP